MDGWIDGESDGTREGLELGCGDVLGADEGEKEGPELGCGDLLGLADGDHINSIFYRYASAMVLIAGPSFCVETNI